MINRSAFIFDNKHNIFVSRTKKGELPLISNTVNPLLSPLGGLFFTSTFEGGACLI